MTGVLLLTTGSLLLVYVALAWPRRAPVPELRPMREPGWCLRQRRAERLDADCWVRVIPAVHPRPMAKGRVA